MSFLFNVFSFNRQSNTDGNTAASPYYQWLDYLRPAAEETGISILNLSVQGHESSAVLRAMQTIGTRLWLLASQLEQLPTRQEPGIEKQAKELMLQLHRIFKEFSSENSPVEIRDQILYSFFENHADPKLVNNQLLTYFRSDSNCRRLQEYCDNLLLSLSKLTESHADGKAPNKPKVPDKAKVPEANRYPDDFNTKLFFAVEKHMKCVFPHLEQHQRDSTQVDWWHPTRLRLGGPIPDERKESKRIRFDVVTRLGSLHGNWTEFGWWFYSKEEKPLRDNKSYLDESPVKCGSVCDILDREEKAEEQLFRSRFEMGDSHESGETWHEVCALRPEEGIKLSDVLSRYKLTVKEKVTLAHTVAQAFWQLYSSDFMRSLWSRDTIWFMYEQHDQGRNDDLLDELADEIPIKVYTVFDFNGSMPFVPESLNSQDYKNPSHRLPHILALGVLLLDIGLGNTDRQPKWAIDDMGSWVRVKGVARTRRTALENADWNGFYHHKNYFLKVIDYCINYDSNSDWAISMGVRSKVSPPKPDKTEAYTPDPLGISERKSLLHDNVIRPLAWLARAFQKNDSNVTYPCNDDSSLRCLREHAETLEVRPWPLRSKLLDQFRKGVESHRWLADLSAFSIDQIPRLMKMKPKTPDNFKRVKIAILDTGYNSKVLDSHSIEFYDFVGDEDNPKPTEPIDDFGHGTLMTALVTLSSPLANICHCRISRGELEPSEETKENLRKAIVWAGTQGVDIVSMSFGFDQNERDEGFSGVFKAITQVYEDRNRAIIFLAAATNSETYQPSGTMFPARHHYVIPIHQTDHQGVFERNPNSSHEILGTLGSGVPDEILDINAIKQQYGGQHMAFEPKPSSSVATAIAAGITATMLTHAQVLQQKFGAGLGSSNDTPVKDGINILERIGTGDGMRKLLRGIARNRSSDIHHLFIDPIQFWRNAERQTQSEKEMHWSIFMSMNHYLGQSS